MLPPRLQFVFIFEVIIVACLLIAIYFIGLSLESPALFLSLGLSTYLLWHGYHFLIFILFIQKDHQVSVTVPISFGIWKEVFRVVQNCDRPNQVQIEQTNGNNNKIHKDFIANVSHELRTPLTVITGYLEAFEVNFKDNQTLKHSIKNMQNQTSRMNDIIEDLLTLSRLEQDTGVQQQAALNVSLIIRGVIADLRMLHKDKQSQFEVIINPDLELPGNETELRSIFTNLINNAINYSPAGGHIKIRWYKKRSKCVFSVQDSGIGIAKKHIERLTERFYRVGKSRNRENGGSGLGLAIVKHILSKYKAELKIKSKTNKGSTFSCHFPL